MLKEMFRPNFVTSRTNVSQDALVKRIFLAVEGDVTEKNYFDAFSNKIESELMSRYSNSPKVKIHLIEKQQGHSSINKILSSLRNKLEEQDYPYLVLNKMLEIALEDDVRKYLGGDRVEDGLLEKLDEVFTSFSIDKALLLKYLNEEIKHRDYFAVVFDRDINSHSEAQIKSCFEECQKLRCGMFLSNPCFEVWLALHFMDLKEYLDREHFDAVRCKSGEKNTKKVLRDIVSSAAHHSKSIKDYTFKENYWNKIPTALENAKKVECKYPSLLENLGTNIPDLINMILEEVPVEFRDIFDK